MRIEPGHAFGTGTHPSTALAGELLEEALDAGGVARILDVGTGSGVLEMGALTCFSGFDVVATEADPDALLSLRENLDLNPLIRGFRPVLTRALPFHSRTWRGFATIENRRRSGWTALRLARPGE